MKRLCVVCEGKTEAEFVKQCLAPHLSGVWYVYPSLLKTSIGKQGGGNVSVERLAQHIALEYRNFDCITTLVDYYGFKDAGQRSREQLEKDIWQAAEKRVKNISPSRLIPYIQMHEFEGLLFSAVSEFQWVLDAWNDENHQKLQAIRSLFPTPEDINKSPDTAPSKRLLNIFGKAYSKTEHGPIIAEAIGLARIRQECPLFDQWIQQLQALGL